MLLPLSASNAAPWAASLSLVLLILLLDRESGAAEDAPIRATAAEAANSALPSPTESGRLQYL